MRDMKGGGEPIKLPWLSSPFSCLSNASLGKKESGNRPGLNCGVFHDPEARKPPKRAQAYACLGELPS